MSEKELNRDKSESPFDFAGKVCKTKGVIFLSVYMADAYLRLSYTADRTEESDSIQNQKKLIQDYVAVHPDIEIVSERVDDGYSGVLFVEVR